MRYFRLLLPLLALLVFTVLPLAAQDAPADPNCAGAPQPRLVIGAAGQVLAGQSNNMRDQPTTGGTKVGQIPAEGQFTIIAGPVCADGFNWWQVDYQGLVGWTVEGSEGEYWVEPIAQIEAQPTEPSEVIESIVNPFDDAEYAVGNRLEVGAVVRLRSKDDDTLWLFPNPEYTPHPAELVPGTIVTLVEEGANGWWRVEVADGTSGWMREGRAVTDRMVEYYPEMVPVCPLSENRVAFMVYDDVVGTNIYTLGMDGRRLCNMTYNAHLCYEAIAWSPDGKWLAYTGWTPQFGSCSNDVGDAGLYLLSADGSELRRIVEGVVVLGLSWSPDSQSLAYLARAEDLNNKTVHVISIDDPDSDRNLTPEPEWRHSVQWSPDGTRIAYVEGSRQPDEYYDTLYVVDLETDERSEVFMSDWRIESVDWSPDSQYLATSTYINVGQAVLLEIDASTGEYELLYDRAVDSAAYSPDGSQIAFWREDMGAPRWVEVLDRSTGDVTEVARLPGVNGNALTWMPDGTSILVDSGGVMRVTVADKGLLSLFLGGIVRNEIAIQPNAVNPQ